MNEKPKILIADDSKDNQELLEMMLEDDFELIMVDDGKQACEYLKDHSQELSLVLLDIVMPNMDGFGVLIMMNQYHWLDDVPAIMISSETSASYIERAYDLGATDFISRPFNIAIVQKRVANTIDLAKKQRRLIGVVADQMYEREKNSDMMISILSHIVESRNGESGLHVLHINMMTRILLNKLVSMTDEYSLSTKDISLITLASALHDIGKISIASEILNKPGRFTPDEFAIMKTHTLIGAAMLEGMASHQDEPLIQVSREICRWHHERWDGNGYPDGLKGNQIPISAQVVSLADVYDALTSVRCYKDAYSHDTAIRMILNGECGVFNPILLDCLIACQDEIREELKVKSHREKNRNEITKLTVEMMENEDLASSQRLLQQLEVQKVRAGFLEDEVGDIIFTYYRHPETIEFTQASADLLCLPKTILDPFHSQQFINRVSNDTIESVKKAMNLNPKELDKFVIQIEFMRKPFDLKYQAIWSTDARPQLLGVVCRLIEKVEE